MSMIGGSGGDDKENKRSDTGSRKGDDRDDGKGKDEKDQGESIHCTSPTTLHCSLNTDFRGFIEALTAALDKEFGQGGPSQGRLQHTTPWEFYDQAAALDDLLNDDSDMSAPRKRTRGSDGSPSTSSPSKKHQRN